MKKFCPFIIGLIFTMCSIYSMDDSDKRTLQLSPDFAVKPSLEVQQMCVTPLDPDTFKNLEAATKERLLFCKKACRSRNVNARSGLKFVALDSKNPNFSATQTAETAFVIGVRYTLGTPPVGEDVKIGEQWLLQSRKYGYLPAHAHLVLIAQVKERYGDMLQYAFDAVKDGLIDNNYFVADAYLKLGKHDEAKTYFKKTVAVLEPYRKFSHYQDLIRDSQKQLAFLLLQGNDSNAHDQAIAILRDLSLQGDHNAQWGLALHYLQGAVVPRNAAEGLRLLFDSEQKIDKEKDLDLYCHVVTTIARTYEGVFGKENIDIQKAVDHYKKNQLNGAFELARLTLINKIQGDKKAAEEDIKKSADSGCRLAQFLIGCKLLFESPEQGMSYLQQASEEAIPIVWLQLAIGYKYGMGVTAHNQKADSYLSKIKNNTGTQYRSLLFARGYMRLIGLGVKQDIPAGLRLIEESETKIDDVFFKTEELLPSLERLKKKHEAAVSASAAVAPIEKTQSGVDETPFSVSKEQWNDYFQTADGSLVKRVNHNTKQIEIFDSVHNEKLVVYAPEHIERDLASISALTFHPRILQRQRVKREDTKHDHTFAQMLDYVVQYYGQLVPFVKDGISQSQDCLIADVTRIDLSTGKKRECRAEYTFMMEKDSGDACVYHRLLRPKK